MAGLGTSWPSVNNIFLNNATDLWLETGAFHRRKALEKSTQLRIGWGFNSTTSTLGGGGAAPLAALAGD